MQTFCHGKTDEGSILLRSIITLFIFLICFSAIYFGFAVVAHNGGDFLRDACKEIQERNANVQDELR
ncbi:MAG TPA: hypothetical protein GXZ47_10595 [Treponema sp.]|nr:hypothetical protein [Treponema sp.]HKM22021.1 hypothetical protein [Lachnospiraceae bacterium]